MGNSYVLIKLLQCRARFFGGKLSPRHLLIPTPSEAQWERNRLLVSESNLFAESNLSALN